MASFTDDRNELFREKRKWKVERCITLEDMQFPDAFLMNSRNSLATYIARIQNYWFWDNRSTYVSSHNQKRFTLSFVNNHRFKNISNTTSNFTI